MQKSKLGIDFTKVERARSVARNIALDVQVFVDKYTTVAVERTLCRLLGIDGINKDEAPLPNIVIDHIRKNNGLSEGVMFWLGNAVIETGLSPQQLAERIDTGQMDITRLKIHPTEAILSALKPWIDASLNRISERRERR
ncbi:MAG: D-lysine 5,6-aminomutase subunit alpha, partial [Bacteroidetes bacterium HGW-Bacteroidetes-22]